MSKTLIVANPRGIPDGHFIIRYAPTVDMSHTEASCGESGCEDLIHEVVSEVGAWYEGETFKKPKNVPQSAVDHWQTLGFLVEVESE
jgi:hypothetical protein